MVQQVPVRMQREKKASLYSLWKAKWKSIPTHTYVNVYNCCIYDCHNWTIITFPSTSSLLSELLCIHILRCHSEYFFKKG